MIVSADQMRDDNIKHLDIRTLVSLHDFTLAQNQAPAPSTSLPAPSAMKSVLAYALLALGASAAVVQKRVDPGCPASLPNQVPPPRDYLCSDYVSLPVKSEDSKNSFCRGSTRVTAMEGLIEDIPPAHPLDLWPRREDEETLKKHFSSRAQRFTKPTGKTRDRSQV